MTLSFPKKCLRRLTASNKYLKNIVGKNQFEQFLNIIIILKNYIEKWKISMDCY